MDRDVVGAVMQALYNKVVFVLVLCNISRCSYFIKVQLFWESHKNLRHPPYDFDIYLVNGKTIFKVDGAIFLAFLERLNFA